MSSSVKPSSSLEQVLSPQWQDVHGRRAAEYTIVYVGLHELPDFWRHHFVVVGLRAQPSPGLSSSTLYVRAERDKRGWLDILQGNLVQGFRISDSYQTLVSGSHRIAHYTINPPSPSRSLLSFAELVDESRRYSARYDLFAFNCRWFAASCYKDLTSGIPFRHLRMYIHTRPSNFPDAMSFVEQHYFLGHWEYGLLVNYVILIITSALSFITNLAFLACFVPSILIFCWSFHYVFVIMVRDGLRAPAGSLAQETRIGILLARQAIYISLVMFFYGLVFLVLSHSTLLEIVQVEKRVGD